jgi:AraC-like DNA-binding protein
VFRRFTEFFEDPRPPECRDPNRDDSRVRKDVSPGLAIQIEATVMGLTGVLIEATEKDIHGDDHSGLERLKPAIDFMDEAYLRNPPLTDIAQRVHLESHYFARLFKRETGLTPFRYMENRRLDLARKLLFDRRLRIGEIAERTGYQSLYYFSRAFRRRFGVSPSGARGTPQADNDPLGSTADF